MQFTFKKKKQFTCNFPERERERGVIDLWPPRWAERVVTKRRVKVLYKRSLLPVGYSADAYIKDVPFEADAPTIYVTLLVSYVPLVDAPHAHQKNEK